MLGLKVPVFAEKGAREARTAGSRGKRGEGWIPGSDIEVGGTPYPRSWERR